MIPGISNPIVNNNYEKPNLEVLYTNVRLSSSSVWSLNGLSLGKISYASPRYIIVSFTVGDFDFRDTGFTMSASLNGIGMTQNAFRRCLGSGDSGGAAIFIIREDVGITGNLSLNVSRAFDRWGVAVYRAVGLASDTPTFTNTGTTSVSLTVPTNGFGILSTGAQDSITAGQNYSGTGVTLVYNSGSIYGAGGYRLAAGTQTHGINATKPDGTTSVANICAAWQFI